MCFVMWVLRQVQGSVAQNDPAVILGPGQGGAGLGWAWGWSGSCSWGSPALGLCWATAGTLFPIWEAAKQGRSSGVVQSHPAAWLLESQTSAGPWNGSCSIGRDPTGSNFPSCTAGAALYQQLCREREKTAFTESSLVSCCLGWVNFECFYGLRSLWHKAWYCLLSGTH